MTFRLKKRVFPTHSHIGFACLRRGDGVRSGDAGNDFETTPAVPLTASGRTPTRPNEGRASTGLNAAALQEK